MSDMSDFEQWCIDTYGKPSGSLCFLDGEDLAKAYQAAKQSMQGEAKKPEYFSITDGDNWFECPDDSAILDCVNPVSVGTEYEVMAAYPSIRQTYRITKIPDDVNDDTEVELIASSGDLLYTHAPDSAARIAEQDAEIARLKMAIEYNQAGDDAEWEPPHPIFQLAQERDNFMNRVIELQKELEEARKVPDGYALVPINPTIEMLEAATKAEIYSVFDMARPIYKAMVSAAINASLNIKGGAE